MALEEARRPSARGWTSSVGARSPSDQAAAAKRQVGSKTNLGPQDDKLRLTQIKTNSRLVLSLSKSPNPRACGGKRRAPRTSEAEAPRSGADAQPSRRGLRGGRRGRTPRRVQKTGSTGAAPGHAAGDDGSAAVAAGGEAEPRAVGRVPGGREKELRPSTRGRRSGPEAGGVRGTRGAREAAGR